MKYRRLGNSGLKVSEIGLGGNNFGKWAGEEISIKIIHRALELGINFIDTANVYGEGRSEEIVGKALQGKRSEVVIATKFGHPVSLGPKDLGGSRINITRAIDLSLKHLNTDYIDLYYMHWPDEQTPMEETLRTLNDLVRTGKVRYIGCSNFAAWQLCGGLWTSRFYNLEPFIAIQSGYNMLDRAIERELVPCCERYGIGVIPWGPLASGFLTGKYKRGQAAPPEGRLASPPPLYRDIMSEANYDKLEKLESFAAERGHNVGELALSWLLSHRWLSSVIAGATSPEQLESNVGAANWELTAEDIAQLEKII